MSITQKVFSSRALNVNADTYVGQAGHLFYTQTTATGLAPVLKYSDGSTVGGLPLSGSSLTFSSSTPPPNPHDGLLWWNTTDGRLYIYYDNSWVDASPDIQGAVTSIIAGSGTIVNTSTGAVTVSLNPNVLTTGSFFAVAVGRFVSTVTQTLSTANYVTHLTPIITDSAINCSSSGTRILITKPYLYDLSYGVSAVQNGGGNDTAYFWWRYNGVDIPNTLSIISMANNNQQTVQTNTLFATTSTTDYVELMWAVGNVAITLAGQNSQTVPFAAPASPSFSISITPIIH